jgi:hypothetical protein
MENRGRCFMSATNYEGTKLPAIAPLAPSPGMVSGNGSLANGTDRGLASLFEEIDRVAGERDELEEGEPLPSREAVGVLKSLIAEASSYLVSRIPLAHVSTFHGELSVTWRNGDRMVRLASFSGPKQGCRMDYGSSGPDPLGKYSCTRNVTASGLAAELTDLFGGPAETATPADG